MNRSHGLVFWLFLIGLLGACASTDEVSEEESEEAESELLVDLSQFEGEEGEFCIPRARIHTMNVLGDQAIEFKMKGGGSYINILPNACPGLRPGRTIMYETRQSQLCHVDIIRVMESFGSGMQPIVTCGLGRFYEVPQGAPAVGGDADD